MNKLKSIIIGVIAAIILFPIDTKADEMPEATEDKIDVVNLVENSNSNIIGATVQLKADMKMLSYNELKELLEEFISKGFENNTLIEYIEDEIAHRDYIIENETTEDMEILNGSPNKEEAVKIVDKYAQEESLDSRQEKVYKLAMEVLDEEDEDDRVILVYLSIFLIIISFGIAITT